MFLQTACDWAPSCASARESHKSTPEFLRNPGKSSPAGRTVSPKKQDFNLSCAEAGIRLQRFRCWSLRQARCEWHFPRENATRTVRRGQQVNRNRTEVELWRLRKNRAEAARGVDAGLPISVKNAGKSRFSIPNKLFSTLSFRRAEPRVRRTGD